MRPRRAEGAANVACLGARRYERAMKLLAFASSVVALTGCATALPPAPSAASPRPQAEMPATEAAPEAATNAAKGAAAASLPGALSTGAPADPAAMASVLDPLAVDGITEAATIPEIVHTPAKELRRKSRADLDAALTLAKQAPSVDAAVDALVKRLGKPTWTEAGQRRVWVAPETGRCHRLVVDSDGAVELEVAPAGESKMLSAAARQKLCSGEITRGL